MAKFVVIKVNHSGPGNRHFGRGNTMRAAIKDAAENATNDLSKLKVGESVLITRLADSIL